MNELLQIPKDLSQRIDKYFETTKTPHFGFISEEEGFTRAPWSSQETNITDFLMNVARKKGLTAMYDSVGNGYINLQGEIPDERILIGSHADTVPHGGNFDGLLGLVSGLEAMIMIKNTGVKPRRSITLGMFRGEESPVYGEAYLGSLSATGRIKKQMLEHISRLDGIESLTLENAILNQGFNPDLIKAEKRTLDMSQIKRYLEVHIEQGNILWDNGIDIGLATSIRGASRYEIEITGGNPEYRDVALSKAIVYVNNLATTLGRNNHDLVQTFGKINTDNAPINSDLRKCALTKVPGYGEVQFLKGFIPESKVLEEIWHKNPTVEYSQDGGKVIVEGRFDHSGATPMGIYRSDANLFIAELVNYYNKKGNNVPAVINYPTDDITKVLFDFRSSDNWFKDDQSRRMISEMKSIIEKEGYNVKVHAKKPTVAIDELDKNGIMRNTELCRKLGLSYRYLDCGAGHDLVNFHLDNIPSELILIPCKDGLSHCPEEFVRPKDRYNGVVLLANRAYQTANDRRQV